MGIQVPLWLVPCSDQTVLDPKRSECAHQMHVSYYGGVTLSLSIDEVGQADLESHGSPDHANDV